MDKRKGYISLWRSITEWEWWFDKNVVIFWLYCLSVANWQDKEWKGITIHRGEFAKTRKQMSEETPLSEQEIRTAIEKLISTKNLTKQLTKTTTKQKVTIYKVLGYDDYQTSNQDYNQECNQTATKQQPRLNNINNNNIYNNTPHECIYDTREDEDDFVDFKVAKKVRLSVKKPPDDLSKYSERTRQYIEEYRRSKV